MGETRPRPTRSALEAYAAAFNDSETLRFFDVTISFPEGKDCVRAVIDPLQPGHRGGLGSDAVNGGVLAAIFDLLLGCTCALVDPGKRSATMQLSMSFLQPLRGPSLQGEARIERAGRDTVFSNAQLFDADGKLCATATGVMKLSGRPWASGVSPAVN